MTSKEVRAKTLKLQAEELASGESEWYYLSFADQGRFRGGCIVSACGPTDALIQASRRGISPGGEVLVHPMPAELVRPEMTDRLMSLADMEALGLCPRPVREMEEESDG